VNFDPFFRALHTLAMGLLAGTSLVIALRLLGFARAIPVPAMERLFPILWLSFWIDAGAGVARKTALLAITSVVLWAAAITVGRLLPYTYHRLLVDD
jgi:hypothetical protein